MASGILFAGLAARRIFTVFITPTAWARAPQAASASKQGPPVPMTSTEDAAVTESSALQPLDLLLDLPINATTESAENLAPLPNVTDLPKPAPSPKTAKSIVSFKSTDGLLPILESESSAPERSPTPVAASQPTHSDLPVDQGEDSILNLAAVGAPSKSRSSTSKPKPSSSTNTTGSTKIHLSKTPSVQAASGNTKTAKPVLMTLNLNKRLWLDTDAIPWPDGELSLPVRTLAKLFDMNAEKDDAQHTLTLNDDINQQSIIIDWKNQAISTGVQKWQSFKHPITHVENGLVVNEDVYIDREIIEKLLNAKLTIDMDNAVVGVDTERNLRILGKANIERVADDSETPVEIETPTELHGLVEKFSIASSQNTNYQNVFRQGDSMLLGANSQDRMGINISTLTTGISGTVLGQPYFIKPTFMRYNGSLNLQQLEWGLHHDWQRNRLTLGSVNAGLTPLIAPNLPLWGLNFASRDNAMFPFSPQQMFAKSESSYSAFAGRIAARFTPINPNQHTPLWMPQSNKWLMGGRYLYGVTDRLTVGISAVADHIFGQAKTFLSIYRSVFDRFKRIYQLPERR